MAIFSSGKDATPSPEPSPVPPTGKKLGATPTRREAEAARRQRISPTLTPKEARKKARAANVVEQRQNFERADNVPGRVLMRRHVDSRWGPTEWSMPAMMMLLAMSLLVSPMIPALVTPTLYATWAFMALVVIDIYVMWRQFKQLAAERIPNEPLKGLLNYGLNRSLSLRRLRRPVPEIKRGEKV